MERKKLIEKLEKWVEKNPEDADALHINLATGKKFTIRGILDKLDEEEKTGVAVMDEEDMRIEKLVEEWMGEMEW